MLAHDFLKKDDRGFTPTSSSRSVLVFEQSPAVVLVAVMTILKGGGSPSKTRGVIALGVGAAALILMDRDASGGVLLLMAAVFIKMAYDSSFRHLAVEIGGPKRLYALVTLVSSIILTPPALLILTNGQSHIESYFEFTLLLITAASFVMVLDFYTESVCFQHVADPVMASARWSPVIMFSCAFALASLWYSGDHHIPGSHALSGGVLVTLICFSIASFALTSSSAPRSRGGHYVGLSDSGVPLYTYGEAFLQKTSRYIKTWAQIYDYCKGNVMGLVAAVMSRWPASRYYSYGYGRVEVLSEKESFFHLIQSMCPSYRIPYRVTKGLSVGYSRGHSHEADEGHHGHSHTTSRGHGHTHEEGDHGHGHGHNYEEDGHGHGHAHSHSPDCGDAHGYSHDHSESHNSHSHAVCIAR
ncbi:Zinc transporter 5 [Toxocara canis]|uniref:Zinc transporter 5 n=1 Tax=Toxocara canis TaxID=6265 RepID=A0A0B2VT03_TOXCA|nr:Zinc transporter 5 [Toxocara canis]